MNLTPKPIGTVIEPSPSEAPGITQAAVAAAVDKLDERIQTLMAERIQQQQTFVKAVIALGRIMDCSVIPTGDGKLLLVNYQKRYNRQLHRAIQ